MHVSPIDFRSAIDPHIELTASKSVGLALSTACIPVSLSTDIRCHNRALLNPGKQNFDNNVSGVINLYINTYRNKDCMHAGPVKQSFCLSRGTGGMGIVKGLQKIDGPILPKLPLECRNGVRHN